ncbi:hypothetical protein CK203_095472 [Vitis vinifera]|uniref:Reverse transcriptase zinc-binding domain-containing protein n=1 Tax=Vitis vinifera TaxID=29760 RepID=A0A438EIV4_VITVI|nr:hypothetical protein CK203_095472 [Vitis vinifera]
MILALNGWMLTKKGKLIVKSFLFFEAGKNGSFLGKGFDIGYQLQRGGWSLVNHCFLCMEEKEFVDHILLHCA